MTTEMTTSQARRILRTLRTGSAPEDFARELFVGQRDWFEVAVQNMQEVAEDEHFDVRFIKAKYGGGKTHFLHCLEAEAKAANWITAYILLQPKIVELDRFDTLVAEIADKLELPEGSRGLRALLKHALHRIANLQGRLISELNYQRAMDAVKDLCDEHGFDWKFSLAMQWAMFGFLESDDAVVAQVASWLSGGLDKLEIDPGSLKLLGGSVTRASKQKLNRIGLGDAEQLMRLLALLARKAGFTGLLIALDEIELIIGMSKGRRDNSFQTLRALVDHKGRFAPLSTCLFLSATPEMFESPNMFPHYKALMDRIADVPSGLGANKINYMAPVVNLDSTELDYEELEVLAQKIVSLHIAAGGEVSPDLDRRMSDLADTISAGSYVIARPRLMCRCVIDLLDGQIGENLKLAIAVRAQQIAQEREKKVRGE